MAARATRSASRKARLTEAVATGPLGALSHDELGVIFDGLADPLQPVVAIALSSTCLGLRTPLRAARVVLMERCLRTMALCRKNGLSFAELRDAVRLDFGGKGLTADDMATLAMILRTNGLPMLQRLWLDRNRFGDAGMQTLCEGLGPGAVPALRTIHLYRNEFGPVGAEALAGALRKGAMPKLANLDLRENNLGRQGVAALTAPLRAMPALNGLYLSACGIGDEAVASLVDNLGKDDFKKLERLRLDENNITRAGADTLANAVNGNTLLMSLRVLGLTLNDMSLEEEEALEDKLEDVWPVPRGVDEGMDVDDASEDDHNSEDEWEGVPWICSGSSCLGCPGCPGNS